MFSLVEEREGVCAWLGAWVGGLLGWRREDVRRGVMGTRARDLSWVCRVMSFFSSGGMRWVSFSCKLDTVDTS